MVKPACSFSGDCGAEANNGDYKGNYGVIVNTIASPNAAIGSCYCAWGRLNENCASGGSVIYNAQAVCVTAGCGGTLDSEFTP